MSATRAIRPTLAAVRRTAAPRAAFRGYATPAENTRPPVQLFGVDGTYASALVRLTRGGGGGEGKGTNHDVLRVPALLFYGENNETSANVSARSTRPQRNSPNSILPQKLSPPSARS
jgi:hypothetical protein